MIFLPWAKTSSLHPETREHKKKPTCPNTLRYSSTSVYSLTGPSVLPSCPLSSHPKSVLFPVERLFPFLPPHPYSIYTSRQGKARPSSRRDADYGLCTSICSGPTSLAERLWARVRCDFSRMRSQRRRSFAPSLRGLGIGFSWLGLQSWIESTYANETRKSGGLGLRRSNANEPLATDPGATCCCARPQAASRETRARTIRYRFDVT
jgi:hypothetical protein